MENLDIYKVRGRLNLLTLNELLVFEGIIKGLKGKSLTKHTGLSSSKISDIKHRIISIMTSDDSETINKNRENIIKKILSDEEEQAKVSKVINSISFILSTDTSALMNFLSYKERREIITKENELESNKDIKDTTDTDVPADIGADIDVDVEDKDDVFENKDSRVGYKKLDLFNRIDEEDKDTDNKETLSVGKKRVGIYSSSFDPITRRDIWIISNALNIVDSLIIVIENNSKNRYTIDIKDRISMIHTVYTGNERISFADSRKTISEYMRSNSDYIEIKVLGNDSDTAEILDNYRINTLINSEYKVIYLPIPHEIDIMTAYKVKEVYRGFGNISNFVPDKVVKVIENKLA